MKKILIPTLLITFIIPFLFPLFHKGFFLTDDGNWMIIRFSAFYEALRSGQFPVRFLPRLNNGFGYPVADFLYPLFMYLAIPIKIVGFSCINTIKILFGLSIIFSGIFSFLWLQKIFSKKSALIGAIMYALFPYHLWDMYQRGSIGEILAITIVPLILWQIERRNFLLTTISLALLIPAHNSLALLFLPIMIVYMLIRKYYNWQYILLTVVYALGIAAFFWIPALFDKQFTVFDTVQVSNFFSYFSYIKTWNLIGIVSLFIIMEAVFSIIKKETSKFFWFFFCLSLLSILLTLPVVENFWKLIPGKEFIQFPFRFLSVTILGVSGLTTYTVEKRKKISTTLVTIIIILLYFSSWNILPKNYQDYADTFYTTNQDSTTVKNEYMPIWAKHQTPASSEHQRGESNIKHQKIEYISGDGNITDIQSRGTNLRFNVITNTKSTIQLPIVYFPGWVIKVDNIPTDIRYKNPNGLIQFLLPIGRHTIVAYFTETNVRMLADIISLFSVIMTIFAAWLLKKYAIH